MNILSEKDLNAMEFNFLVKPATTNLEFKHDQLNCQNNTTNSQDRDLQAHNQDQDQDQDKFETLVSTLKLKTPSTSSAQDQELGSSDRESSTAVRHDHEDSDGFKTPTSSDRKIPAVLKCPPAPRKPKPMPSAARRRRSAPAAAARRRILLDLTAEIESLFPPAVLADLIGGKIKKFRERMADTSTVLLS